ncbi:MAG TPA: hypothetical protein VMV05_04710 [bacterium]|nr:hypothetical protein [bacterium]
MKKFVYVAGTAVVVLLALPAFLSAAPASVPNNSNPNPVPSNRLPGKPKASGLNSKLRAASPHPPTGDPALLNQQLQSGQNRKSKAEEALSKLMKKSKENKDAAVTNVK